MCARLCAVNDVVAEVHNELVREETVVSQRRIRVRDLEDLRAMVQGEIDEICTIIYYPREKLRQIRKERVISTERHKLIINRMIGLAKMLSSKYTRSKVRKAMPPDYAYIIDELLHAQKDAPDRAESADDKDEGGEDRIEQLDL